MHPKSKEITALFKTGGIFSRTDYIKETLRLTTHNEVKEVIADYLKPTIIVEKFVIVESRMNRKSVS